MKSTIIFLAFVAISQGIPLTTNLSGRIVNGEDAKEGEFPYQVSLQTLNGFPFCGGSILDKNYVITAAHCIVHKNAGEVRVIAGTVNLNEPRSVHSVEKIIMHAEYTPSKSWLNDIALLKVEEPFEFSETISNVRMPKGSEKFPAGSMAVTSGWGALSIGGSLSKILQRADVLIADHEYCDEVNSKYGYPVYKSSHVCAHDPDVSTGSCHGDSGGPLTVNGRLVGITSWAIECASRHNPTVYTRVQKYLDWIRTHAI